MSQMNKLMALGKQLARSNSEEEFRQAIECATDFMGASMYSALAFDSNEKDTYGKGVRNVPVTCSLENVGHQLELRDPVMQHCRTNSSPILWDRSTYCNADLSIAWEYAASHGIQQGIDLALHLGKNRHFCLGFSWNHSKPLSPAEQATAELSIQTLAVFAEPAAFRFWHPSMQAQCPEPLQPLSPRERECLCWVSRGMTDELIARLLKISARTVRKHVDSCICKLSAANRTEAAVAATRLGLLNQCGTEF